MALAAGYAVTDVDVGIRELLVTGDIQAIQLGCGSRSQEVDVQLGARPGTSKGETGIAVAAARLLVDKQAVQVEGGRAFLLQPDMLEFGIVLENDLAQVVVEIQRRIRTGEAFYQGRLRACLEQQQVARLRHDGIGRRRRQVQHLYQALQLLPLRDMDNQAVVDGGRVECAEDMLTAHRPPGRATSPARSGCVRSAASGCPP